MATFDSSYLKPSQPYHDGSPPIELKVTEDASCQMFPSSYRTPFYLFGRSKIEASVFELPCGKHPVECHAGGGKNRVACRGCTPDANSIAGCPSQGFESLV